MHWNLAGEADRWSSSRWEVLLLPLISLGTVVLCHVLPRLDPKLRHRASEAGRMPMALRVIRVTLASFFAALFALQIAAALEWPLPMPRIVTTAVLLLLMVGGNYLGNLRQNYFFGIRTPWTLEDAETWRATHRRGGQLLFFGSAALLLLSFILSARVFMPIAISAAVAFVLWTFLYSWQHYQRHHQITRAP